MAVTRTSRSRALLVTDATNRALRTFLVSIIIDVGIAVVMFLWATFNSASSWGDVQWGVVSFSLVKTALASIGSYILRRYTDGSGIPTPLPPAPQPEPADPA